MSNLQIILYIIVSIFNFDNIENSNNKLKVGEPAMGGLIFHVDKKNDLAYIVALDNIGEKWQKYSWGCPGKTIVNAQGMELGDGRLNTLSIVQNCDNKSSAANACYNAVIETYDDWYLPSLDELELIANLVDRNKDFKKKAAFDNSYYITSTELKNKKFSSMYVWSVNPLENMTISSNKTSEYKVRAVRAVKTNNH